MSSEDTNHKKKSKKRKKSKSKKRTKRPKRGESSQSVGDVTPQESIPQTSEQDSTDRSEQEAIDGSSEEQGINAAVEDTTLVSIEETREAITDVLPKQEGPDITPEDITTPQGEPVDVEIETIEDQPMSRLGQYVKNTLMTPHIPIDLRKQLLPNEKLLNSKLVIYFSEGQLMIGVLVFMIALISYFFIFSELLLFVLIIGSFSLFVTGYASEELHITNSRILIRRMTWSDRFFRIPRDFQYILDEIVSFDIRRAPPNMALVYSALIPPLLLLIPDLRTTLVIFIVVTISLTLLILGQRLDKRTVSFAMSGGHIIHLGMYKGIPAKVVESFIDIVMEKNIFESDPY